VEIDKPYAAMPLKFKHIKVKGAVDHRKELKVEEWRFLEYFIQSTSVCFICSIYFILVLDITFLHVEVKTTKDVSLNNLASCSYY
jgi:hypothetical protein